MFEAFFCPKNPTKLWQRAKDLRLNFDLERGSLNGARFGDPLETISFLGPVEELKPLQDREYSYPSLGLSIGCDENTIDSFHIGHYDKFSPLSRPFPGQMRCREQTFDLPQLREQHFVDAFGPPFWRDEDESEFILFYEFPWIEWQVEFGLDGTFNCILVTCKPMLADEGQRSAYGITRPWPPRG